MKLTTLQKLGGISLVLGALLLTAYSVLFTTLLPTHEMYHDFTVVVLDSHWIPIATVAFFGVLQAMFGFTIVYSKLYQDSGVLGLLGYIFIEIAYLLQACKVTWEIFLYPIISGNQAAATLLRDGILQHHSLVVMFKSTANLTILAGIVLFCWALFRSKAFPKIAGVLVFIGALMYGAGPVFLVRMIGISIFSIGCLILGITMFREKEDISA